MSFTPGNLLVIGIVLVILLVAFGPNSIEEARKKRELKKAKTLVEHIMEYNKDHKTIGKHKVTKAYEKNAASAEGDGSQDDGSSEKQDLSNFTGGSSGATGDENAFTKANPYHKANGGGGQGNNSKDDYYPPPPLGGTSNPGPHSFLQDMDMDKHRLQLPNGKKLAFDGIHAYTINHDGVRKPLPDGNYPMFGGAVVMAVRDGKKVLLQ